MSKVDALNRLIRPRGVTLVRDFEMATISHARHLARLLDAYQITCVLDVGANLGQFRDFLTTQVRWSGPVVSFEPVQNYYRQIADRARTEGSATWRVFDFALGSKDSTETITTFDSPGLASIRAPNISAMEELLPKHAVNRTAATQILVKRLDRILREVTTELDISRIFLKIDTQGYDLEVFRGARDILDLVHILQIETSFLSIYHDAPDFIESINEIRAAGFFVSGLFPVTHDDKLRVIEVDCLYVRP